MLSLLGYYSDGNIVTKTYCKFATYRETQFFVFEILIEVIRRQKNS